LRNTKIILLQFAEWQPLGKTIQVLQKLHFGGRGHELFAMHFQVRDGVVAIVEREEYHDNRNGRCVVNANKLFF
jgi:hypothetical protein